MEFVCPVCMGSLVSADGENARCTVHEGQFRILFSRHPLPLPARGASVAPVALAENAVCAHHPSVAATHACRDCETPICATCAFSEPDGSQLCPQCATRREATGQLGATAPSLPLPEGVRCVQHPHLAATGQCKSCGAFMCGTCAFQLPGGIQVCPACAISPQAKLSPKRKKMLIGSFVMASWCTLVLAALMGGLLSAFAQDEAGEQALGMILFLLVLAPSIIGVALGVSSMERRLENTAPMWIATVWNGLILGAFLLLMIYGATLE